MIKVNRDTTSTASGLAIHPHTGFPAQKTLILGLILLAAWLRLWHLRLVPPGFWFDEAYNAMDAAWMLATDNWPVFLVGNNGREPLFHYILALSITFLGESTYSIRLVSAFLGILAIPLMYRWSLLAFKDQPNRAWIALLATAGLVTSFWALTMNRAAYRANLLPIFVLIVSYFFWQGWQTRQLRSYLWAGVGLGLSQYSYLAARLLPLVFVLFVLAQTLLLYRSDQPRLRTMWLGLAAMGGIAVLVASPLLLFFIENPVAFWGRVSDVVVKAGGSAESLQGLGLHLWQAGRVFIDSEDPNWRHHLLGRPGFNWFNLPGFLVGLVIAVKNFRQPIYLFLLTSLFVMWLPAPLSEPAFHTLRLAGILPSYYLLVTIGFVNIAAWVTRSRPNRLSSEQIGLIILVLFLLLNGGVTFYDYFYRWANRPQVYAAYETPVVELADHLIDSTAKNGVIIPYYLYTHASMRYRLHHNFAEAVLLPDNFLADRPRQRAVSLIVPEIPPDDGAPPGWVWLIKNGTERGTAYVSLIRRDIALIQQAEQGQSILDSRGKVMAHRYRLDLDAVLSLFKTEMPQKAVAVAWDDNLRLRGYEFVPSMIEPGQDSTLYLAWEILGYTGLKQKMFLQLLDDQANPVGQQEIEPISRKMYRWRADGFILEQHPLNLGGHLDNGLYFVRLGFFDPETQQRLPAYNLDEQPLGDEVIVGPLYVGKETLAPQYPTQARLGEVVEILGVSLSASVDQPTSTTVTLFWQMRESTKENYTIFVQLLDPQNGVIAQHDGQPFNGLYPTSRWQVGEVMVDKLVLPVSPSELSGGNRLVTGMYVLPTGLRLPAYRNDQLLPDGLVDLEVELP